MPSQSGEEIGGNKQKISNARRREGKRRDGSPKPKTNAKTMGVKIERRGSVVYSSENFEMVGRWRVWDWGGGVHAY